MSRPKFAGSTKCFFPFYDNRLLDRSKLLREHDTVTGGKVEIFFVPFDGVVDNPWLGHVQRDRVMLP
jgi:hypothetical protein